MRPLSLLSAFLGLTSAASISPLESRQTACNNSPLLCSKPYSGVVHLGAHDSPFVRDASTGFSTSGNQYYNSTVQLSAGVRLLTAQVHQNNGGWHLCHTSCDLIDAGTLTNWLTDIKQWLDENPNEVVTILLVNSDNATPAELHSQFSSSGILSYAYIPSFTSAPAYDAWPTLQSLIGAGTRLVTFIASISLDTASPDMYYLMPEFNFVVENQYDNVKFTDFSCAPNRPTGLANVQAALGENLMPLMNHFLDQAYSGILSDIETPDVDNITITNSPNTTAVGMLGQSANDCTGQYGRPPTFILVDFFDQGPAIETVDRLNGVSGAVGRTPVPARSTSNVGNAASWAGVQALVEQVQSGQSPSRGAWIYGSGKWSFGGINLSGGSVLS